jgi:hypothetical protein
LNFRTSRQFFTQVDDHCIERRILVEQQVGILRRLLELFCQFEVSGVRGKKQQKNIA